MLKNSKTKEYKIGVFDSGLGGLTVLKKFLKFVPGYHYIYLGDTARVPYGDKSPDIIYEYVTQAVDFLFRDGCQLVIIACNTASAQALRKLQQEWLPVHYPKRRVLGVIRPLAEAAAKQPQGKTIGVIGTKATTLSRAYEIEIKHLNPGLKVISQSAPLLVPLIEDGHANKPETTLILKDYLKPLQKVDVLILACTHYPFLHNQIKKIMGPSVIIPDTGKLVALSLKDYLNRHRVLPAATTKVEFYTTDNPKPFKKLAEKFLGSEIKKISQIKL
jgi:glutamate racemase